MVLISKIEDTGKRDEENLLESEYRGEFKTVGEGKL